MIYICFQEPVLFFGGRVLSVIEGVGRRGGVIVVAPFGKVICKFQSRNVGGGVFEIDHD